MDNILNLINKIISIFVSITDRVFTNFENYSKDYSRYIVYALLLWLASSIFKVKLNLDTNAFKK